MNKNRMTVEELKKLKPTFESPVVLVCDDEKFTSDMFKINVIGVYRNNFGFINGNDQFLNEHIKELAHYPSMKSEPKIKDFYLPIVIVAGMIPELVTKLVDKKLIQANGASYFPQSKEIKVIKWGEHIELPVGENGYVEWGKIEGK